MQDSSSRYDAVVVGGSLAGSAAAIALGRSGARVALVERSSDANAFKRICSHHIQASAIATLDRLGLLGEIEAAGGFRCRIRLRTRYGWADSSAAPIVTESLNIRRERLDPLIRAAAERTPGVDLTLGETVDALVRDGDAVSGVETRTRSGRRRRLEGKLVVGADGRYSKVAELAGVATRRTPNARFCYGAYAEGPKPEACPEGGLWLLDPDMAAVFITDSDLVFYGCMPTKDRLPEFKRDPRAGLVSFMSSIPDAPPIRASRFVSPVIGKLDMTNVQRVPTAPGLALVGDAALAIDPLWGVGCGWALQSGEWLADSVAPALGGDEELAAGLKRYRQRHRKQLGLHARLMHDYASGRRMNAGERLFHSAAARDASLAALGEAFATRSIAPTELMTPRFVARAVAVNVRHALRRERVREARGLQPVA